MSHPQSCHDPDCNLSYRDHLITVGFGSSAFPSRLVNTEGGMSSEPLTRTNIREKRWHRDMAAYKRLLKQGYNPPHMEGSALREREGKTREDIELRPVSIDYGDPA